MPLTDPLYYLHNFQTMLDTLRVRDGDLLAADERDFMEGFTALPLRSRALLVRMIMRKGALFRASRLLYAEIGAVCDAIAPSIALGWIDDAPRLTLDDLFRLLSKADLVTQLALPPGLAARPKAELLATLREAFVAEQEFAAWCGHSDERVYRLSVDGLCDRLRLMFFGNFRQTLSEFVLADLGVFKFESTTPPGDSRPFRSRAHVDAFLELHRCRERFQAGDDPAAVERALPAPLADCEWLRDRREKLRFQIARAYERAGLLGQALTIYADCGHPESRRRAERVLGKQTGTPAKRPAGRRANPPEFVLTLARPDTGASVEALARTHLEATANEITRVYFVENALINSLFGLLCWRAVFAPVQGAFFHAFHHGPADLASAGFHARRRREFAECLAELDTGSYQDTIRRHFVEKSGIASPFVAWGLLDAPLLETALTCFPAAHLAHWFDWILRDVTVNRTGFPDLVQFWPASARYRLIEIKGPGDRLQDNQRRCLEHCLAADLPVSVCRVRWRDAVSELA
jgi:hypothetical protein